VAKDTSRRAFVSAISSLAGTSILPRTLGAQAQSGGSEASSPRVDQNTVRRRGIGLRAFDPARASAGLTLFAPMQGTTVYLINLRGEVVHTWKMPYPPGSYGYLTDRGTLFYNGKLPPDDTFIGSSPFRGGVVLEADWNGKVLWELRRAGHHHDGSLLRNGNVLLVCAAELPDDVAKRVRGGRPGTEVKGKIWADYLVEMTKDGRAVWEWRSWEHLDPAVDVITGVQDDRSEWTHGNSVEELPDGNLLASYRNISTIAKIDRKTGDIIWKLGAPPLSGQHAPTQLPNGNILIFDNGPHRLDVSGTYSRVIEVDPATKKIVWRYMDVDGFYSPRISNAQRLPNGNTLVNEGIYGRFFEVTSAGDVVWEYVNPFFGPDNRAPNGQFLPGNNRVFRIYRYAEEQIDKARKLV
jgi:hypothetical protein